MADQYPPDPPPAGSLVFRSTDQPDFERTCYVYPHEELHFGRSYIQQLFGCEDRSISKHHLRIRCIGYDDDGKSHVTPLIYARVLSGNTAILVRNSDETGDGVQLGRDEGDVLLNPGDYLQLTNKIGVILKSPGGQSLEQPALDALQEAERARLHDQYRLTKRVIGAGGYASVWIAEKSKTCQQFACKVVPLPSNLAQLDDRARQNARSLSSELKVRHEKIAREYNLLQTLSHPNIIAMEKIIRTSHNVYIFQELITGGDLLSFLDNKGPLPEPQAAMIVRQILEAVKYLHSNQVVHRDIKPENILMTSWRDGARVVLTDFGQSRTMRDVENAAKKAGVFRMQSMVGTAGYTAPEIYRQKIQDLRNGSGYSQAVDIWSIGCVTATILTSEPFFPDHAEDMNSSELNERIGIIETDDRWQHIGHRAKSFVRGCLATRESQRLTAVECLALPWFQHPHYKAEFDAAYKHAIADWKPRQREIDEEAIEFIDTSDLQPEPSTQEEQQQEEEDTQSRHVPQTPSPFPLTQDVNAMAARWRPYQQQQIHVSPARMPESIDCDDDFDDLDRNLSLASQNTAANIAALQIHARQAPPPTQWKRICR